ncbi:hypothetical protein E2C01_000314 [Portunus trituberculatus]|uniref:Uncharacterized protein n=1 Tax=Portunus trituberculatus TaxID=210409 RepID=A0A5B7CET9_PORTR|nr:hypothetical protein [Portunus trituberculatus]
MLCPQDCLKCPYMLTSASTGCWLDGVNQSAEGAGHLMCPYSQFFLNSPVLLRPPERVWGPISHNQRCITL